MNSEKTTGRIVGALFIGTTIAGILSVISFGSSLGSPVDLARIAANETQVRFGA
jgi:hypothetical protein